MNAIKKLKSMGFKKAHFHKVELNRDTYEYMMVPDNIEIKTEYINGKRIQKTLVKVHPKSDSFWILKYSENYILWCLVKNHQIDKIWLEDKSIEDKSKNTWNRSKDERVQLIFDISRINSSPLNGKDQIMDLFPKEVRRDFLLEQLFGF